MFGQRSLLLQFIYEAVPLRVRKSQAFDCQEVLHNFGMEILYVPTQPKFEVNGEFWNFEYETCVPMSCWGMFVHHQSAEALGLKACRS